MWKSSLIVAVLAAFVIDSSRCDFVWRPTCRPPLLPQRIPRGTYDPPPYLYEGDIPKASTADHPILPSIIDDVKFNPNKRTARSLSTSEVFHLPELRPSRTIEEWVSFQEDNRRIARDLRLPGPDYEVPKVPRIPLTRHPWNEEQFDRVHVRREFS